MGDLLSPELYIKSVWKMTISLTKLASVLKRYGVNGVCRNLVGKFGIKLIKMMIYDLGVLVYI